MADKILNIKNIQLRHDTALNWDTVNPILLEGELGVELITYKFKFGDGVTQWTGLPYSIGEVTIYNVGGLLDANDEFINPALIPALNIIKITPVNNEAEMLALDAVVGVVALRIETSPIRAFILQALPATTLANWAELVVSADAVSSVNGQIGVVILTTDDINEGTNNLYYTDLRFNTAFNTAFGTAFDTAFGLKTVADLSDGSDVVMITDTLILDGGGA